MGDIAEYYSVQSMELEWEEHAKRQFLRENIDNMEKDYMLGGLKWGTENDGSILLSKMSKLHVDNTIKFLKRKDKNEIITMWIKLLSIELDKR